MRKSIIYLLVALLVGFLIFALVMKAVGWQRVVEALTLFLGLEGLAVFLLTLLSAFLSIWSWRVILEKLTGRRKFKDIGKIWFAGFTFTYLLTPIAIVGGEPVRVYLAKKLYSLDTKTSFSSIAVDRIFEWALFLIFTIGGIFAFLFYGDFPSRKMGWFVISLVGGLSLLLLFFFVKSLKRESTLLWFLKIFGVKKEKLENLQQNGNFILEAEKEVINFLSLKKKAFWQVFGISFLRFVVLFFRAAVLVLFLGGGTNLVRSFAIYGINNLALISPIPATIGTLEATGILSFDTLGLGKAAGTIFAMVLRDADVLMSLIGIIFLVVFSLKLTGEKILRFIEELKNNRNF